ncbi:MAG: hypothetical protein IVW57_09860 [Ktedonobacterales bacterium]|nr:hypothetical protein [Ktedonobacterales bacterium]
MPDDLSEMHEEDARAELQAMLAASRDLGPDMDRALVDSYLERQRQASRAAGHPSAAVPVRMDRLHVLGQSNRSMIFGLLLVAYIAALVFSHGWLFWLIFPLMGMAGGARGQWGHREKPHARDDYRLRRHELRHEYRMRRLGTYSDEPEEDERREDRGPARTTPSVIERAPTPPAP